jgi:hypothetical protein
VSCSDKFSRRISNQSKVESVKIRSKKESKDSTLSGDPWINALRKDYSSLHHRKIMKNMGFKVKFLKFLGNLLTLLVSKANLLPVHQIKKVNRRQVKLTVHNQIPVTTQVKKPLTTRRPNSINSC